MSYTQLIKTELLLIEDYLNFGLTGRNIADKLNRDHESVYRVIQQLLKDLTAYEILKKAFESAISLQNQTL